MFLILQEKNAKLAKNIWEPMQNQETLLKVSKNINATTIQSRGSTGRHLLHRILTKTEDVRLNNLCLTFRSYYSGDSV